MFSSWLRICWDTSPPPLCRTLSRIPQPNDRHRDSQDNRPGMIDIHDSSCFSTCLPAAVLTTSGTVSRQIHTRNEHRERGPAYRSTVVVEPFHRGIDLAEHLLHLLKQPTR